MVKESESMTARGSKLEEILDFCVSLARDMVMSGANLERVSLGIERICRSYGLSEVSLFLLSNYVSLGARDEEGRYAYRQMSIPAADIHLQRLKQLNRMSYVVAEDRISPDSLQKLLERARRGREYPDWAILLARMCAMSCLCLIFGGWIREVIIVMAATAALHGTMHLFSRVGLDRVVINAATMFLVAAVAILLNKTPLRGDSAVIFITISLFLIPGIPLVNAVRNMLCGNEMNGILQFLKVVIETMALGVGLYLALWILGGHSDMSNPVVKSITNPFLLVVLSFLASASFGVNFRIGVHDLWLAGLGGALTRVVFLLLTSGVANRLVYVSVAALFASLYAEILATKRKDPSTYFVYPSIIPLIPGDLFYYSLLGLYIKDQAMFEMNSVRCILTLFGMSIGFVVNSFLTHYWRKMRYIIRQKG